MEALEILSKYVDKSKTKNSPYVWKGTPNRTEWSLSQSVSRFTQYEFVQGLKLMVEKGIIKENFTILDIFCGTGAVLYLIKEAFPKCQIIGVDLLIHKSWDEICNKYPDSKFFPIDFFELKNNSTPLNIDVAITFNTFRGWDNPVGPETLLSYTKKQFSEWVKLNFNYFITDKGPVSDFFKVFDFSFSFNNLKISSTK
jgi:hypothetical protein